MEPDLKMGLVAAVHKIQVFKLSELILGKAIMLRGNDLHMLK